MENGAGYWLKFPSATTVSMSGTSITLDTIPVNASWNMIGSVSYPVLTSTVTAVSPVTILSAFFGFSSGSGYSSEDTLKSGKAHWVKVSQAGQLVLQSGSVLTAGSKELPLAKQAKRSKSQVAELAEEKRVNILTFKDAEGKKRSLHFSAEPQDLDKERFELPPTPPEGIFDVRFRSQRAVEFADREGEQEFPITFSSVRFPLTISWDVANDSADYTLEIMTADHGPTQFNVRSTGNVILSQADILAAKLLVTPRAQPELPKEFALYQNYPNPFNPITTIRYDLPKIGKVSLRVYDLLGQEVATLVDETQEAGYKSVRWNSTNHAGNFVASGVYFYRLEVGQFVDIKKLMVIK